MPCNHAVSPAVGKPVLALYLVREPTFATHCSITLGTADEPVDMGCWESGPFDDDDAIIDQVNALLVMWLRGAASREG